MERVAEIARVGSVDPENSAFDIFHRADIDFIGEDITKLDQSIQLIEEFGLVPLSNLLDQNLPVGGRSGEPERFQQRDFASAKIDFAMHPICLQHISRRALGFKLSDARPHPFR
jgi:hypothetical protein